MRIITSIPSRNNTEIAIIVYITAKSRCTSNGWTAHRTTSEHGSEQQAINHTECFADPENPEIHTQNTERSCLDVKERSKRPGNRQEFSKQYLTGNLFFHRFLVETGKLYPPLSDKEGRMAIAVPDQYRP